MITGQREEDGDLSRLLYFGQFWNLGGTNENRASGSSPKSKQGLLNINSPKFMNCIPDSRKKVNKVVINFHDFRNPGDFITVERGKKGGYRSPLPLIYAAFKIHVCSVCKV